jgi:hypothetical protein
MGASFGEEDFPMKKRLIVGALGATLAVSTAIPARSAFGISAEGRARRCEALVTTIQILRAQRDAATDPLVKAAITQGGQKVVNKATRLGCVIPPP